MKQITLILIFLLLILNVCPVSAQEISQQLVGTNLWYTNPSTTVWNLTKQGGFQTIRIGGAEYDRNMPGNATILNWVKQIRSIGAEPIVQVSQYKSAADAAALVKYLNIDNSDVIAPVKYWNIGNEPWLQNYSLAGGVDVGGMVETYFKPIAAAMKEVDPGIKIYGPDFCYYVDFAINDLFGGKNDIAGKVPGKDYYYCDGISWHKYPQNESINLAYGGIDDFKSSIVKCKQKVDQVNASHNRTGDDALVWGIGEFNAKNGSLVHSWENGQMFGGILGLCMKYEAKYATTWSMFESGGNRQGTDFSMIDGANMTPRASYRHMEFVAKYFKGEYIDGTSSSNDFIVYGSQNEEEISVMIMHRASGLPKEYTLLLNDTASTNGQYNLKVNAGLPFSYNDIINPRSTQVIIFRGDSITKINYTSIDFENELPPTYSYFELATALPEKPFNLRANPLSYNSIELTWNNNSDNEQGFIIEREGTNGFQLLALLSPDSTSFTDTDLTPETEYKYRVRAYNSLGKSDYSEIVSGVTMETPAPKAYNGPHYIPGKIQAEDFNDNEAGIGFYDSDAINEGGEYRTTGVDIETCTDVDGGYDVGYIENGEWLSYLIDSVKTGTYDIALRVASNVTGTHKIDVYIDDVKVGQVLPANTGGWQNWETQNIENVEIQDAQPKLLKLSFTGTEFNINWFEFIPHDNTLSPQTDLHNLINSYYSGSNQQIIILLNEVMNQTKVQIFNTLGQPFYQKSLNGYTKMAVDVASWPAGIYLVTFTNQNGHMTQKLGIK